MAGLLKVSEAAVLAIHTVAVLGGRPEGVTRTRQIASYLGASEAHLSKVLQRLVHTGMVASVRGPKGGFRMARDPEDVTLLEGYEAIDGPVQEAGCLLDAPVCDGSCIMGGLLEEVTERFRDHLGGTTVAEVAVHFCEPASKEERDRRG